MIGADQNNYERLYLQKDNENEIFVDNSQNLKQHEIDSLRFLYQQFKKKKHGAVLNFPAGSGKSFVVALFLNALSSLLKESVLILCIDDEEINHWKNLFLTWTDFKSDDIAVESSNPRLRKKIFLKKVENLTSYSRCHWSVVVIKDEDICKTIKKVVLEADLKIWITSTDIQKDTSLLLFIYKWMFPKSNVINEVLSSQVKHQNKLTEAIIMNTFLDDFVIRDNKLRLVKETKNSEILKRYRNNQKTKKNKDITGTKIKKSKRSRDDSIQQQNIPGVCNVSTEISEPKSEFSGNELMEINDNICDNDSKINGVQIENSCIQNVTDSSKIERNEELDFKKDIKNENICIEENSTESLDFGDTDIDDKNILQIEKPIHEDISLDTCNIERDRDNKMEDTNIVKSEKSEINDFDNKMSELEEKTLKKFKGSILDSIF